MVAPFVSVKNMFENIFVALIVVMLPVVELSVVIVAFAFVIFPEKSNPYDELKVIISVVAFVKIEPIFTPLLSRKLIVGKFVVD